MALLDFFNDVDGKREVAHGSDGRLNVSSRSDDRIYYISRDQSEAYSIVFDDAGATAGDYLVYLKNTNTNGKHLILHGAGVNSIDTGSSFKLVTVTDTPSGGAAITPTCMNRATPKTAAATVLGPVDSNSTPMTLTAGVELGHVGVSGIYGHEEFRIADAVRLGQDKAIAIELEQSVNTDVRCWGAIFFYYE